MSLDIPNVAHRAALHIPAFATMVLLALVLAYWTWNWLAPRPAPRAQPMILSAPASGGTPAHALFGNAPQGGSGTAPTGIAARLLGVVAASGAQAGFAILKIDTNPAIAVREGEEVAAGVRLAEVRADHVVLERNGMRETLAWPMPATTTVSASAAAAPRAAR